MKPPKKTKLDEEFWRRDAETKRLLQERIAYHERKLKERATREKR